MYNISTFYKYLLKLDTPDSTGSLWDMDKLCDNAPEEAVKAFEKYKEDLKEDFEEDIFS